MTTETFTSLILRGLLIASPVILYSQKESILSFFGDSESTKVEVVQEEKTTEQPIEKREPKENKWGDTPVKCECIRYEDGVRKVLDCSQCEDKQRPQNTYDLNVQEIEQNLNKRLVQAINNHRRSIGLRELTYSQELYNEVTLPHNKYQVENEIVTHDEYGKSFQNRVLKYDVNFYQVGENVASHQRWFEEGLDSFFIQYMNSKKHKELIENPNYTHYASSVIYDSETNFFYNTFNVGY